MFRRLSHAAFLLLFCASSVQAAAPARRLVLFGGGDLPPGAMDRFIEWAGGKKGRLLVIPWSSGDQGDAGEGARAKFLARGIGAAELCVSTSSAGDWAAAFRRQLAEASGVFITGGDQNRFMAFVDRYGLLGDFEKAYASGKPFAGTSAGTAVMSRIMLTGEANLEVIDGSTVGVRSGLGLLPGVIVDQHFILRQRENRLFGLVLEHPDQLGVGVDESAAFAVEDDRYGEAFGTTGAVMIVEAREGRARMLVDLVRPGKRYDLKQRRHL